MTTVTAHLPQLRAGNGILGRLPADEWNALRPTLRELPLRPKAAIFQAHSVNTDLYFVDSGLISVIGVTAQGQAVEVALVGPEGVLGISALLGHQRAPYRAAVQMSGTARVLDGAAAREWLDRCSTFRELLFGFLHALLVQCAQGAVCNRFHNASQRLARWLLTADDRVGPRPLELTQEFLAEMLGIPRTWLTRVARQFQETGLINYRRGVITIANRAGLLDAACECYKTIREDSGLVPDAPPEP